MSEDPFPWWGRKTEVKTEIKLKWCHKKQVWGFYSKEVAYSLQLHPTNLLRSVLYKMRVVEISDTVYLVKTNGVPAAATSTSTTSIVVRATTNSFAFAHDGLFAFGVMWFFHASARACVNRRETIGRVLYYLEKSRHHSRTMNKREKESNVGRLTGQILRWPHYQGSIDFASIYFIEFSH